MITKAITSNATYDNKISIILPKFNQNQFDADICGPIYYSNIKNQGNVVYVDHENNQISKPIVLGYMQKQHNSDYCDINMSDIDIKKSAKINSLSTIGNSITYNNLKCLEHSKSNIQANLDVIKDNKLYESNLKMNKQLKNIKNNDTKLDSIQLSIDSSYEVITNIENELGDINSTNAETICGINNILTSDADKLNKKLGSISDDSNVIDLITTLDGDLDNLSKKIDKKLVEMASSQEDDITTTVDGTDTYFEYDPDKTKIENMISYGLAIANNNYYIYGTGAIRDFGYREVNGKKYKCLDCASFIWYCIKNGGWPIDKYTSAYGFGVRDLEKILKGKMGWSKFDKLDQIRAGDVLWSTNHGHTELAIGNGQRVGAHYHDPSNPAQDISIRNGLNTGQGSSQFNCYFRPPAK